MKERKMNENQPRKLWVRVVWLRLMDLIFLVFLGISLLGGVSYQGKLYLKHAADTRRAALLAVFAIFLLLRQKGRINEALAKKSLVFQVLSELWTQLHKPRVRWGVYLVIAVLAVFVSVLQCLALETTLWDVGIFHQIVWSLSQGLGFHSSISGAGNFLFDHSSLSLVILVPLFKLLGESPLFLPIIHPILIFGGAAAWILLVEDLTGIKKEIKTLLSIATLLFILSFDSLWRNIHWGFHENAIAFFTISWAMKWVVQKPLFTQSAFEKARICLFFLIAAGSKEILLLDIALVFVVLCWTVGLDVSKVELPRKESSQGRLSVTGLYRVLFGLIAILLVVAFVYFENLPKPAHKNYFNRYYSYLGQNLDHFLISLLKAPSRILEVIGAGELVKYTVRVLLPWLGLPLALAVISLNRKKRHGNKALWIVPLLPSFLSAALSTFPPLRDPSYHYVLELWPFLACLTLVTLAEVRSEKWIWFWICFSLLKWDADPLHDAIGYWRKTELLKEVRQLAQNIPLNLAVSAEDRMGPWIAGRKHVTRWPDVAILPEECPDILLLTDVKNRIGSFLKCGTHSYPLIEHSLPEGWSWIEVNKRG